MAIRLAAPIADFDRMAQLLERMRVTDPAGERWKAAFDELRAMVAAQAGQDDNVRDMTPRTPWARTTPDELERVPA